MSEGLVLDPAALRRLAAIEASRGSFDQAVDAVVRACGQQVGKRQLEALTASAAVDFEAFRTARQPPASAVTCWCSRATKKES